MSLKPTININPVYTTNNIDTLQAGLYQIAPNNSNLIVRVNTTSNIGLSGEIKLNTAISPYIFQGYNGSDWLDLNASVGETGPPGKDFIDVVNFNNLPLPIDSSILVSLGNIFATTSINVISGYNDVNIRSLQGSTYIVNSNLTVNSVELFQSSNIITVSSLPLPYKWDFSGTNNTITKLKNANIDNINYSWGDSSIWIVKQDITILKGQAVCITNDINNSIPNSNLVIIPLIYTSLVNTDANPFTAPLNMLGIATQTVIGGNGNTCVVCTKGITTVLCTDKITNNFFLTPNVATIGIDGIVGKDGGIFCNTNLNPTVNYVRAGYFLEHGTIANNGDYALFYVEPRFQIA